MKTALYVALLSVLVLSGLALTVIYYTQDFSENINIKDTLSLKDIQTETRTEVSTSYGSDGNVLETFDTVYLVSAKAHVGDIKLTNDGVFEQQYRIPIMVGCINTLSQDGYDKDLQFTISTDEETAYYRYYNDNQKVIVDVGKSTTIPLYAHYHANNALLSEFTNGNVKNLTIFVIDEKEDNPLADNYYYSPGYYSCADLQRTQDPEQTILII